MIFLEKNQYHKGSSGVLGSKIARFFPVVSTFFIMKSGHFWGRGVPPLKIDFLGKIPLFLSENRENLGSGGRSDPKPQIFMFSGIKLDFFWFFDQKTPEVNNFYRFFGFFRFFLI